jgi:hypothetical protein
LVALLEEEAREASAYAAGGAGDEECFGGGHGGLVCFCYW